MDVAPVFKTTASGVDTASLSEDQKKDLKALDALWLKREQILTKVIKVQSAITQFLSEEISVYTLKANIAMLERISNQFEVIQSAIYDNSMAIEEEEEENEVLFRAFFEKVKNDAEFLSENQENNNTVPPKFKLSNIIKLKLPAQQIPEFKGDILGWRKFKETFVSLIHENPEIPNVQKFHYLLGALKNNTDNVVREIPVSCDNYEVAWQALLDRYDNTNLLIDAHLEKLLTVKQVSKDNVVELRSLLDTVQSNVRALTALKVQWNVILVYMVKQKLDVESRKQWQLQTSSTEYPKYDEMMEFLNKRCLMLESIQKPKEVPDSKSSYQDNKAFNSGSSKFKTRTSHSLATEVKKEDCQLCSEKHRLFYCPSFLKLTPQQRVAKVRELKVCVKCLSQHIGECSLKGSCRICSKDSHNTLLHVEKDTDSEKKEDTKQKIPITNSSCIQVHCNRPWKFKSRQVLMGTAEVLIEDRQGNWHKIKALLDSASQSCFVTERLVQILNLKQQKIDVPVSGIGEIKTTIKCKVNSVIKSRNSCFKEELEFLVVSKIASDVPCNNIDISKWKIPVDIQLADPSFYQSSKIDMLIGTEWFYNIMKPGKIELGPNNPCMYESELGWIVAGSYYESGKKVCQNSPQNNFAITTTSESHKKFPIQEWRVNNRDLTQEDMECEQHYQETFRRNRCGRYVLRLPLKVDSTLGESKSIAYRRLQSLQKQFDKNPQLQQNYDKFIKEYCDLGHMEVVPDEEADPPNSYYIPHHAVIKASSTTTQLRVVFNASSKTTNQKSLNDVLMVGPNIQNDLRTILLNFLIKSYVFIADIEKMF